MPAYNLAMPPPQPALNAPGMVPLTEDYGPGSGAVPSAANGMQQGGGGGGGGAAAGGGAVPSSTLPLPATLPSASMPFMGGSFGGAPTLIKQEQPVLSKKQDG